MSIKTSKKEKDKLYADIREIKQILNNNADYIQFLNESMISNHSESIKLHTKNLDDVKANGKLEAQHSFMIGVMVGAMAVMVLLTLISIFA